MDFNINGNRPSLSELHHLIIPGQKEVKVIQAVANKWKRLALELGFELSLVESIGSRYSDSEEDCESLLRKWLMRQDGTVSWEVLMTALENIGLYSIADDLEKATGNYWLPGANVIGLATASIRMSTELEWKEFEFMINITLAEYEVCNVTIAAAISGKFEIPSNAILVSVVYYIQLSKTSTPATAKCELEVVNSRSKRMMFGIAWSGLPYTFNLSAGDFAPKNLHGSIHLPKTPLLLAAFHSPSSGMLETKYFAHVFSQREGPTLWRLIVVAIPRLAAFEQIVKKQYPLTSHRNELTRFYFEFDTNETEITLIPEDSSSSRKDPEDWIQKSDETVKQCQLTNPRDTFLRTMPVCQAHMSPEGGMGSWKIIALKSNKISRQEMEEFHSTNYLLPTFEFMMQYSVDSDEVQRLDYKFILIGAKPPQRFFRIYPSRDVICQSILKIQELEIAVAEIDEWETLCEKLWIPLATLNEIHSTSIPRAIKKRRCMEAFLCTGHACWETVVKAVADSYNKKLAKNIADRYSVDYSWAV